MGVNQPNLCHRCSSWPAESLLLRFGLIPDKLNLSFHNWAFIKTRVWCGERATEAGRQREDEDEHCIAAHWLPLVGIPHTRRVSLTCLKWLICHTHTHTYIWLVLRVQGSAYDLRRSDLAEGRVGEERGGEGREEEGSFCPPQCTEACRVNMKEKEILPDTILWINLSWHIHPSSHPSIFYHYPVLRAALLGVSVPVVLGWRHLFIAGTTQRDKHSLVLTDSHLQTIQSCRFTLLGLKLS